MEEFDNLECELRYCPECGAEIYCRSASENVTLFFVSAKMEQEVQKCPECELDLKEVPVSFLDEQPKPSVGKDQNKDGK